MNNSSPPLFWSTPSPYHYFLVVQMTILSCIIYFLVYLYTVGLSNLNVNSENRKLIFLFVVAQVMSTAGYKKAIC